MNATKPIRDGLRAATCALVGLNAAAPADATEFDTSFLSYTETGGRINAFESTTRVRQALAGGKVLTTRLVVDIMTGASPNGATPSNRPQTFTRPSGLGSYTVPPGETPLDDTFQDNRFAIDLLIEIPASRSTRYAFGGHTSVEYDYISVGATASVTHDLNKRNTTLTAGAALSQDYLDPQGGPPIPFAPMQPARLPRFRQIDAKEKVVVDALLGATQVISRRALMRVNYSFSQSVGYLTDPFKVITVVDALPGANLGEPLRYIYENRPDIRTKHSLYGALKYHLATDIIDLAYRHMRDDWDIHSHTVDVRFRKAFGRDKYIQPQFRYYHQSQSDFYAHSLVDGAPLPKFASADYRLGEFDAFTLAVKTGFAHDAGHKVSLRLGYYVQMGERSPPDAIGAQQSLDLFPTVHAILAQVSYNLSW